MSWRVAPALALVWWLGPCVPDAAAHTRSQSYSAWTVGDDDLGFRFSVSAREVTRLPLVEDEAPRELAALLVQHLQRTLRVGTPAGPCARAGELRPLRAREGYLRVEGRFRCEGGPVELRNDAFFEVAATHLHFARVERVGAPSSDEAVRDDATPPADATLEYLFTDAQRTHVLVPDVETADALPQSAPVTFGRYVRLGVEHILIGADHLAFLLALLLVSTRLRSVVAIVSGFTVGHSVTLSLAALGHARPDMALVEALIGFTIALVAAENLLDAAGARRALAIAGAAGLAGLAALSGLGDVGPSPLALAGLALFTPCYLGLAEGPRPAKRLRPALTVVFGLVHGFGFASVLMEVGLPRDRLVPALFGFNVGVELGQLAVVAAIFALGRLARARVPRGAHGLGIELASAALLALGVYWFLSRAYA